MERKPTDLCLLCRENTANKRGSHLIPAFITSSALNLNGSNVRDKEFMMMFRNQGFGESYFGQSVLPEAIEQVKSKELISEEQELNDNPNVRDFFFCSECEKKLGVIENIFSQEFYKPLNEKKFKLEKSKNEYDIIKIEKHLSYQAILFFLSVIWRIGIAKYMKLRLPEKVLENLRKVLCSCLNLDVKAINKNIEKYQDVVGRFPLIVLYSAKPDDPTKGIIYCDDHKTPHFLIINQFVLFFYEKGRHLRGPVNSFFGLTELIDKTELVNYKSDTLKIGILNEIQFDDSRRKVLEMLRDETLKDIRILFSKCHEKVFGFRPSNEVIYALAHRIHSDNCALFERYSHNKVKEHIIQFLADIGKFNQYPRFIADDGNTIDVNMP